MKLVLDTKPDSGYRDELARRYHFPSQYKRIVDEAVGDWERWSPAPGFLETSQTAY